MKVRVENNIVQDRYTDPIDFFLIYAFLLSSETTFSLKVRLIQPYSWLRGLAINHHKEQTFVFQLSKLIMEIVPFAAANLINDTR